MKRLLSCISRTASLSFEEAVIEYPLLKYCAENGIVTDRFDIASYVSKFNHEATFVYLYKIIQNFDYVLIPLTNNKNLNLVLDPAFTGNVKIIYVFTGDADINKEIVNYISDKFYIVTMNYKQEEILKERRNVIKLFPFVNEYVFYRDDDIMQEPVEPNYDFAKDEREKFLMKSRFETQIKNHKIDVCFFGRKNDERNEYVKFLADNKINIKAFGDGWSDGFEKFNDGEIKTAPRKNLSFEREILTRSKICVIIDSSIKPVHFESLACNCLFVSKNTKDIDRYFTGLNDVLFNSKEELLKIVVNLLSNDEKRRNLRTNLREQVKNNYISKNFFKELFGGLQE